MELMNALAKIETSDAITRAIRQEALQAATQLLSPIVPHICEALWAELQPQTSILQATWPSADASAMVQDEIELVLQVNGKLRGSMTVARTLDKPALEKLAIEQPCVQKYLEEGVSVRKIIIVPNKLINIVIG
jgi:leucyl-tRNA synthetase